MPVLKAKGGGWYVASLEGERMSPDMERDKAKAREKVLRKQRPTLLWAKTRGIDLPEDEQ